MRDSRVTLYVKVTCNHQAAFTVERGPKGALLWCRKVSRWDERWANIYVSTIMNITNGIDCFVSTVLVQVGL